MPRIGLDDSLSTHTRCGLIKAELAVTTRSSEMSRSVLWSETVEPQQLEGRDQVEGGSDLEEGDQLPQPESFIDREIRQTLKREASFRNRQTSHPPRQSRPEVRRAVRNGAAQTAERRKQR